MRPLSAVAALAAALVLAAPAVADGTFQIDGGGFGHGIGMSQYGAYGYAQHGKSYRFILGHYYQHTKLRMANPKQIIRVLLATGSASFSGATYAPHKRLNPNRTYSVQANADRTLALRDWKGRKVGTFNAPLSVGGPGPLLLAGQGSYRGWLEFRPDGAGAGVQTVDALHLEDYVRGVVSYEMPSSWAPEALKTQAVAARTYAITSTVEGNGFQLYRDTRSQMYGGVAAETPSTDAAVAATRGQVVTYHGKPAITYFSSSSGGHTENVEDAWPGSAPKPWLKGVSDPYDGAAHNPKHRWSVKLTIPSAQGKLGSLVKGGLVGIVVSKHGVSRRIVSAQVLGTRGRAPVSGPQLEGIFGLPSAPTAVTTVTSASGAPPTPTRRVGARGQVAAIETAFEVLELHGRVFPARAGSEISIQRRTDHGWSSASNVPVSNAGYYDAWLSRAGTYRALYGGVAGPAVDVR
jgi:stage II sporulation protein D